MNFDEQRDEEMTACLGKHSHKAVQWYLLTKLEHFTKEELGATVNGFTREANRSPNEK